jgi:hypothetical protein
MAHLAKLTVGLLVLALGACSSNRDPILMHITAERNGPDEFAILPTQPLQAPPNFRDLPQPTPGAANLVDPDPRAQAVAALGGRVSAERGARVDGGVVNYAARFGTDPDIRETLAAEDLEFRRRNQGRVLERLFGVNVYPQAYSQQALDREAELERWRAAGARVPAVPPRQ